MSEWQFGDLLPNHYRTITMDPPWYMAMGTKSRPQHYPRMRDEEIAALRIADLCHPDGAHIFVWITSPIDGPRFWENIWPAWKKQKIRYSARGFVWVKTPASAPENALFIPSDGFHLGQGLTTRKGAEDCLLFKTGKPKRLDKKTHEILVAPIRQHSRKPDKFFERVERYSESPYCELFSRESRPGWASFGNETDKFNAVAAA